jgi:dipeptidyl aminopeptidase/acylaminoacyl peptidase
VQAHFETFRAQAASLRDGEGLPRFVEDEFRDFLRCGSLAGGFARFRCTACGLDRLVAFSCKGRGFCPSCGGRRIGNEEAVLKSSTAKRPTDWSRDGRHILYENDDPKSSTDLWVLPLFGDRKPQLFLQTPFYEGHGRFSPNGKWIAYVSDETGGPQVYVQSFPPSGGKWQVSTNGGVTPRWRRDGQELFYLAPDRKIMSVAVKPIGNTFEIGSPEALFEAPVDAVSAAAANRYEVSADGQRFLVNIPSENVSPAPITVVVNWLANLKNDR